MTKDLFESIFNTNPAYASVVLDTSSLPKPTVHQASQPVFELVTYFHNLLGSVIPVGNGCLILPSVSELARFFHTQPEQVVEAFRMLRQQGYDNMPGGLHGHITLWNHAEKSATKPKKRKTAQKAG